MIADQTQYELQSAKCDVTDWLIVLVWVVSELSLW